MNRKIKIYLLATLLLSAHQPKANERLPDISLMSLQNLQHIIRDHPKLSIFIAALISLLGCKKLLFSSKNTVSSNNTVPKAEIVLSDNNTTLCFTPPHNAEPYCFKNLHMYEISPHGSYFLIRQLQDTSVLSAVSKTIINGLDILATIQTLFRCSVLHHVLDTKTGNIVLTLSNIQQCTFSQNEKYLLTREIKPIGIISSLFGAYKKTTPQTQKSTACIRYRLIDIATKKTIATFDNIFSATFIDNDTLKIIDAHMNIKYFKPEPYYSINPLSCKVRYQEADRPDSESHDAPTITFYFDTIHNTYCLDIPNNNPILHVKTYREQGNYLLVNTDETEQTQLQSLSQEFTLTSFSTTINNMLALLKKPQFKTHIIDLSTGEYINNFKYINPIICSFTSDDTIFIAEVDAPNNTVCYKQYTVTESQMTCYKDGKSIIVNNDGTCTVIDGNNAHCTLAENNLLIKRTEKFKRTVEDTLGLIVTELTPGVQNVLAQAQAAFTLPSQEGAAESRIVIQPIDDSTLFCNYPFYSKTPTNCPNTKINYQKLLQQNIHNFTWNIHLFPYQLLSTNNLDGYWPHEKEGRICISNLPPTEMKYTQYQSLTNELTHVINYMKANTNAIISICLIKNDCTDAHIILEIKDVLKDYNPLFSPTHMENQTLANLSIATMRAQNQRLLFFSDEENSLLTFPNSMISPRIEYIS